MCLSRLTISSACSGYLALFACLTLLSSNEAVLGIFHLPLQCLAAIDIFGVINTLCAKAPGYAPTAILNRMESPLHQHRPENSRGAVDMRSPNRRTHACECANGCVGRGRCLPITEVSKLLAEQSGHDATDRGRYSPEQAGRSEAFRFQSLRWCVDWTVAVLAAQG